MTKSDFQILVSQDPQFKELKKDIIAEKTAGVRNFLHNAKHRLTHKNFNIEGYVSVRVRRAKRNKNGDPIDKDGNPILNIWNDDNKYSEELAKRCVYEYGWRTIEKSKHNIICTDGRDWVHTQIWVNAAAGSAEQAAHEVAVTSDATGTDAADTTLPGEITTGGLIRKNADTVTHTDNTNTTTLVTTFTASAGHTAVQMAGTFYNPTSATGEIILENTFTSTNLVSGDSLELTWTITTG